MIDKVPFIIRVVLIQILLLLLDITVLFSFQNTEDSFHFSPKNYLIYKISEPVNIDGKLDESAWQNTPWTDPFLDIQGEQLPTPRFETRAKMLWDDDFLYIAAQMEEPHLWATIEERDAVIFQENNFEIFIDPDGDTHHYYELEINALKTFWDLMLTKPYRNGGRPINAWDIKGLQIGVDLQGTLNDPSDTDEGWTLEIAIPFHVLNETIGRNQPAEGDQWKLNFSRVEWQTEAEENQYKKQINLETGRPYPEDNWVWSPQGLINMHLPERWGIVQFTEKPPASDVSFAPSDDLKYEWVLRELYYRQRNFRQNNGAYSQDLDQLQASAIFDEYNIQPDVQITVLGNSYLMSLSAEEADHTFYIRDDSRAWKELKN